MVLPIKGPFSMSKELSRGPENAYGSSGVWESVQRHWFTQQRPYTLPLQFDFEGRKVLFQTNTSEFVRSVYDAWIPDYAAQSRKAYNVAYEIFTSKAKTEAAELAVTLLEWKKARSMIADRATSLALGFIYARRGDVKAMKALWGKGAGIRPYLRQQGSHVLEFSFGWAPLVSDLAAAVSIFGNGIPPPTVKGGWGYTQSYSERQSSSYDWTLHSSNVKVGWMIKATVRVTNPNTLLLNQLGLANPAAVAWEMTPWSFVVDYFVNVSSFISSFTDRLGMSWENASSTEFVQVNYTHAAKPTVPMEPRYHPPNYGIVVTRVARSIGIAMPTLRGKPPWEFSLSRAATSVALLLQQLKGK